MVGALDQVFRDEWGRVLANLIGFLSDFDLAEEAAQEAFAIAAERWPRDGAPANPRAWLVVTARNRAIDRIRRERTLAAKTPLLDLPRIVEDDVDETTIPDERLESVPSYENPRMMVSAPVRATRLSPTAREPGPRARLSALFSVRPSTEESVMTQGLTVALIHERDERKPSSGR